MRAMVLKRGLEGDRNRSGDSGVEPDRCLMSKEQLDQRISLFLRGFDHQAKESLQEMKKELTSLLQTAEKAFRVELLMLPVQMRKMKRKDLLHLKEEEAAAVLASSEADCPVEDLPTPKLVRSNSKRVKVTTIVEYKEDGLPNRTPAKKTSRKVFKTHSLVSLPSAVKGKEGYPRPRDPQRAIAKSTSSAEKIRGLALRSASMPCEKGVPFVNIPLADGQTLCSAGNDLQKINVELLNDDTVQHIHTLVSQLTVLCGKATVKSS
ncbi:borealin-2-like isoform X2 [Hemicordylus capensis]|uniref:borealin-2-like isoform X2 n=1 Tax=Hemicordylus capensis TaxID=884348 RepID=UPI002303AAD1|nr:borealin-2-like isoform X2 [Hemicordylus capensis]